MLKTTSEHRKAAVRNVELPTHFRGVSLSRRSGVSLCGISNQAVHIEFVGQPTGKRRFKKIPLLLSSYFSPFHEIHIDLVKSLEATAKNQNCDPTELSYSEFPEIKW